MNFTAIMEYHITNIIWTNNSNNTDWTMISAIGAIIGVGVSAYTFFKSYSKMKETEQIKMAHDIGNQMIPTEAKFNDELKKYRKHLEWKKDQDMISSAVENNFEELKFSAEQYLNQLEWISFLINKKQISDKNLIDYFKPSMLRSYDKIFELFPELKEDFEEFNEICKTWKKL